MKNGLRALTLLGAVTAACSATPSWAQSSLRFGGLLDVGVQRTRLFNGGEATKMSNGFKASRIYFTGSEDLGAGLHAIFRLEGGITVANGAWSTLGAFHRASYVGLSQRSWGTVRFGKALVPTSLAVCGYADLHGCGGGFNNSGLFYNGTNSFGRWISVKPGRGGNANDGMSAFSGGGAGIPNSSDSGRVANAFFYNSPRFAGFGVALVYALGGVPSNSQTNGDGNHTGVGVSYSSKPFSVSLNEEHTDADPLWNASGSLTTIGGVFRSGGGLRVGAIYQRETASGAKALWTRASAWALTAAYRIRAFEPYVKTGVHRTNGTGAYGIVNGEDAKMLEVGSTYSLSKRTVLYAEYARDGAGSHSPTTKNSVAPQQLQAGVMHYF